MTTGTVSPIEVVQSMWAKLAAGDAAGFRASWAEGAVWHLTGTHSRAGDYDIGSYLAMLGAWFAAYPTYASEVLEVRTIGDELIHFASRSTGGEAPGIAEGHAVYGVVGGKIAEGWGIPGDARYGF